MEAGHAEEDQLFAICAVDAVAARPQVTFSGADGAARPCWVRARRLFDGRLGGPRDRPARGRRGLVQGWRAGALHRAFLRSSALGGDGCRV